MSDQQGENPVGHRREPIGTPVVRGDPEISGDGWDAVTFDPDDSASLAVAADVIREFVLTDDTELTHLDRLRGGAACAAVVRGMGSYKRAAEWIGDPVTVAFLRKWSRVHDLPISIRRHIAKGKIAPTAAVHIARVSGDARFILAWSALDHELTVDEIRRIASDVANGEDVADALANRDIHVGRLAIELPIDTYREVHRRASLDDRTVDEVLLESLERYLPME